jgi:hypothetical protein
MPFGCGEIQPSLHLLFHPTPTHRHRFRSTSAERLNFHSKSPGVCTNNRSHTMHFFAVLAAYVASAAAFAPAQQASRSSSLNAIDPKSQVGVQAPVGYFE